jgi:Protein of unknown function (DUF4240)
MDGRTKIINGRLAACALAVALAAFVGVAHGKASGSSTLVTSYPRKAVFPMHRDKFWSIIAQTTGAEANTDLQSQLLKLALTKLSPSDIAGFEATFDALMRESYSWDLWGAAFVVHGGASDDSFEYFRVWLISKGQGVFEAVSKNPDSLADMLASDSNGPLEYEHFAYIARDVWVTKTGKMIDDMPTIANMMYPGTKPSGMPFKESEEYLATRYPKLWKRFGRNPAG